MKENTPEKIYINPNLENRTWLLGKGDTSFIEYTRTDDFIKKACEFLKTNAGEHIYFDECDHEWYDTEELINDFKNYMKGE